MDPDLAHDSSTGLVITMVSGCAHQADSHCSHVSSSASLPALFLFLSHLLVTYLLVVVVALHQQVGFSFLFVCLFVFFSESTGTEGTRDESGNMDFESPYAAYGFLRAHMQQ